MSKDVLNQLFSIIEDRKNADPETSYVASLYSKGTTKIAQKVGEEAVETAIEAIQGNTQKLAEESADLLFHLMVLWADQGLTPDDVMKVLQSRLGRGGHDEKASRKTSD
ncbi:MAG: phosphoribosyl-ATP diphosphatase [Alphaproteobacteria bacterium]|nr:phosphoribosyl-ATP diphosphatase [Alphaproteobacteria bacterium]